LPYFFALRHIRPGSDWIKDGPHETREKAMSEYRLAKAPDLEVETPFLFENAEKAQSRIDHLNGLSD